MLHSLVCLILEFLILGFAVFGNFNFAWKKNGTYGGLWQYCPDMKDRDSGHLQIDKSKQCASYTEKTALFYGHYWTQIQAMRGLLILVIILALPIIILLIMSFCADDCGIVPCILEILFGILQFICMLPVAALMTFNFVTKDDTKTGPNWCFYLVWMSAVCSFVIVIVLLTECAPCWNKGGDNKKDEKASQESTKLKKSEPA